MEVLSGMTLMEMARKAQQEYSSKIVAAELDGEVHDLQNDISGVRDVTFIPLDSKTGWQVYRRSVLFLLITAVHELYPEAEVVTQFTANKGLFCEIRQPEGLDRDMGKVQQIEQKMRAIVAENRPIRKEVLSRDAAVKLFEQSKQYEKAELISSLERQTVSLYRCGEFYDYLYGPMLYETGDLGQFALDFEPPGVLLRLPDEETAGRVRERVPQPKLSQILYESKSWAKILHCNYVMDLNRANREGQIGEVIRVSEALQEKRIAQIADYITQHRDGARLVMIAGPSSSGKTSFAQRLRIQLRVNGLEPVSISLDDYFLSRKDTPRNERGEYDFECLEALDTELFNRHMVKLLAGREVQLPHYNFLTGCREWPKVPPLKVTPDQPIIIEGIHGLNEKLSEAVPRTQKFKIYISALTQLNIDAHNRIPTTDARLLRRLVRDYQTRGAHALKTLKQWPDVRAGEEKNIFPYQEEADVMFNSALIYELGVLKKYAEPLLETISPEVPEYAEARRLLDFCAYFDDITAEDEIPNNSLLREFIGKSVFFK
ncbi:nucleoside kinase [Selenomonas sp.]|uniref:nucleoside kinase n=1 Tax=Selenomonas sp. TaxID=2053611 RepID=UPI0025E1B608|nr:nucleoside kinase [Selenomonas sp.]